jgi:membrane-associated phospholipid phosphatase/type IV secretory pathway TrbD component
VPSRRFLNRSRLIAAGLAALVLLWVYGVLSAWTGRGTVFLFGLAASLAVLGLADWVFDLLGPRLWRLARSVGVSMGRAAASDPEVERVLSRHPRSAAWLRARLTTRAWTGWYLTATLVTALYLLAGFLSILRQVATSSSIALYDPQLAALLRAFRTVPATHVMWIATVFGDPASMWVAGAVFVALLLLWGRRGEAVLVGVTITGGSAFGSFVKVATRRPRPPAFLALIREPASFSFPSGHAVVSLLFFGLLAFVLWRSVGTTARRRFAIVALCAFGALMVALSRVYLGVHWPTDVIGGWYLAAAWGIAAIGVFLTWERYGRGTKRWPAAGTPRVRLALTASAAALVLVVMVVGAEGDPLLRTLVTPPGPVAFASGDLASFEAAVPKVTDKLDGSPAEPVSLVFLGTEAQLADAFARAGWQRADQQSIGALFRVSVAALSNRPYPDAPVTPAFIGGQANDVAFERAQGKPTARRRHHARFWSTNLALGGKPVWVGDASFDAGLEIGPSLPLPTHRIDPAIDVERDLIVRQLTATGIAHEAFTFRATPPETGTNDAGDRFFTDGMAHVLEAR